MAVALDTVGTAGGEAGRDSGPPASERPRIRCVLFDEAEPGRDVSADELAALLPLQDTQLLWVDVIEGAMPEAIAQRLGVDASALVAVPGALPGLAWRPPWKYLQVRALNTQDDGRVESVPLALAVGPNLVVSQHLLPAQFISQVLEDESDLLRVGRLDAMTFAASLLDRMLTDYLDARDEFETALDDLELQILRKPSPGYLRELQQLRHLASRLRQTLADHRDLFDALGRPDFDPGLSSNAEDACRALRARFSHVIGSLENARELVNGSFDVYTSRIAESTNETMYALTVATVVTGVLATVAGILGMNFKVPFFESGLRGFVIAVVAMTLFGAISIGLTLWRRKRYDVSTARVRFHAAHGAPRERGQERGGRTDRRKPR